MSRLLDETIVRDEVSNLAWIGLIDAGSCNERLMGPRILGDQCRGGTIVRVITVRG